LVFGSLEGTAAASRIAFLSPVMLPNWAYDSAPLPATLTAIVAIILAVAIDHFWFGSRRDRKA
jgi:hypothetical protein